MAYASDKKPLELTVLTTLASDDSIIVGDTSDTSEVVKSITKANFQADLTITESQISDLGSYITGASPTITTPTLTLKQSTTPTPTAEGDIQWDTDNDRIVVGDGAGQKVFSDDASNASTYAAASHTHALADISDITASAAELNVLDGIPGTLTATELGYVDGVTSAIQTQLNAKLNTADIDDTPVNGETAAPISSNWAFDHDASTTAHGATGAVVGTTNTQTLTNKRVTPRTGTVASSATPTINTDNVDYFSITALTTDITSMTTNLSGTPTEGQKLFIAITGTAARAITWGASFENGPVALPTTTVTTTRLDVLLMWNSVTSKWRCMASGSTV